MAVEHQEDSQILLEQIMPQIAAQLRGAMGNIHTALTRLVPEEMPEGVYFTALDSRFHNSRSR